ncbi:hypothetical protein [Lysobacter niastensis]|uniref:hypothetical protein n=1 Tax=Lysobacter niastensis TaxID=380629 RepID=UPI001E416E3D|nr:hypothetical protein [Lysobacter niastensis]
MSNASATCRLEWRPSLLLVAMLACLGVLAAVSVTLSGVPLAGSLPTAFLAVVEGVRLGRRELRRPARSLVIAGTTATLDGLPIKDVLVRWRGPMVFMRFRDAQGRWQRLVWWPDTLDARGRRELRLAIPVQGGAQLPSSMAS